MSTDSTMPYEDAPSGHVSYYNYKEPFMLYEGGHGFQGVLLHDPVADKVQCHECGVWLDALAGHIHKEHKEDVATYKSKAGLSPNAALVNERIRALMSASASERMDGHPGLQKAGVPQTPELIATRAEAMRQYGASIEHKNKKGTCPAQLIDRLQKLAKEKGRTPSIDECTFSATIKRNFGSWREGIVCAGLEPRLPGGNAEFHRPFDREYLLNELRLFKDVNGREATSSDMRRGLISRFAAFQREFGSFVNARKEAYGERLVKVE